MMELMGIEAGYNLVVIEWLRGMKHRVGKKGRFVRTRERIQELQKARPAAGRWKRGKPSACLGYQAT
jgi:hypothetical protein